MINYDVEKMLDALIKEGATFDIDLNWSEEERANYIIHQFDIIFIPISWKNVSETAEVAYRQRKFRNQQWTTSWKPKEFVSAVNEKITHSNMRR